MCVFLREREREREPFEGAGAAEGAGSVSTERIMEAKATFLPSLSSRRSAEGTVQSCAALAEAEADTLAGATMEESVAAVTSLEMEAEGRSLLIQQEAESVVFFATEAIARGSLARQIHHNRSQCNPLTYSNHPSLSLSLSLSRSLSPLQPPLSLSVSLFLSFLIK